MRFMGDPFDVMAAEPMDPTTKAMAMAQMPNVSDARAKDLLDLAFATPLGKREMTGVKGICLVAGVVIGVLAYKLHKKRR